MGVSYKLLASKTGGEFGDVNSTRYSLWRDENHLLYVKRQGYSESYKRFYFEDIQAIVVQDTTTGRMASVCHGSALVFWLAILLVGFLGSWPLGALAAIATCAVIAGSLLGVNLYRGPTCATYIYTAVQRERIYALDRLSTTSRVIAEIRPIVNMAQGLTPEADSHAQTAQSGQPTSSRTPTHITPGAAAPDTARRKRPPRLYRGVSHRLLFGALLLNVFACYLKFIWPGVHTLLIGCAVWVAIIGFLIRAVVAQFDSNLWARIQILTWLTPAYLAIHATAAAVFASLLGYKEMDFSFSWESLVRAAEVSPFESRFVLGIMIFSIVCSTLLGVIGNLQLNAFQHERRRMHPGGEEPATP